MNDILFDKLIKLNAFYNHILCFSIFQYLGFVHFEQQCFYMLYDYKQNSGIFNKYVTFYS